MLKLTCFDAQLHTNIYFNKNPVFSYTNTTVKYDTYIQWRSQNFFKRTANKYKKI